MINETIIENAQNVLSLIEQGIITKDEARIMLGLEPKTPKDIEVNGEKYIRK